MNFIFGIQINIEVFYKLILSFWVLLARHAQRLQNKFAYICNISRNTWRIKLIFLPVDKHKRLTHVDSIALRVRSQACPKYPKEQVCNVSTKIRRMKLIFCLQINIKGFFKFIVSFQVFVARHAQITPHNMFPISQERSE